MSRTYRTHLDWASRAYGRDWTNDEQDAFIKDNGLDKETWFSWVRLGWRGHYFVNRRARDKKAWDKPNKAFKSMKRRIERAKVRSAMRAGKYDDVPEFRRGDQWDWT